MSADTIRIGSRASKLAVWQAEHVRDRLLDAFPALNVELVYITTSGDRIQDRSLIEAGGKGLFVKEIEEALLAEEVDIAVHSMKDVPVVHPEGLHVPVVVQRADPRDAFISRRYGHPAEMPAGARLGTSSQRRRCQFLHRFPELEVAELRGNVDTRLRKLDDGEYDAIVLAAAGLKRLGWGGRITTELDPGDSLPAMGQGTIGIECRAGDGAVEECISAIAHQETTLRTRAEWAFNRRMEGGCQVPMGGYAELLSGDRLRLRGMVGELDGSALLEDEVIGSVDAGAELGRDLAERMLAAGAADMLRRANGDG